MGDALIVDDVWFLESNVFCSSDLSVRVSWKCWSSGREGELRWELRRFLPSAGYEWHSKNTQVHRLVRECLSTWQAWWTLASCPESIFGRSRVSLQGTGDLETASAAADAEQEYWVTTQGMLVLLAHWCRKRKRIEDQRRCRCLLRMLLRQTCPPSLLSSIPVTDSEAGFCEGSPAGVICTHEGQVERSVQGAAGDPVERVATCLEEQATFVQCPRIMAHLGTVTANLSTIIASSPAAWGRDLTLERSWLPGLSETKRRRADPHLKQKVSTSSSSTSRSAAATAVAAGSLAKRQVTQWREGQLATLQATAMMRWHKKPAILSSVLDASRLGKPSREYLLHCAFDATGSCSYVFPPAVRMGFCLRQ